MTKEELNTAVYEKMAAEQEKFRAELLAGTPQGVLDHAYEYSIREDILIEMEEGDILTPQQAKALLKSPCPLADVYKDWQDRDSTDHMETVRDVIESRANDVIRAEKEKRREAR